MFETTTEHDYSYLTAGRRWLVPSLELTRAPDGTVGISRAEIRRIHRAVGNELCGMPGNLNAAELEFLCDVSDSSFTELAEHLGVHKSTVTKWRHADSVSRLASLAAKRWFWFKLFGGDLPNWRVPLKAMADEEAFLSLARQRAISEHVVQPIRAEAA